MRSSVLARAALSSALVLALAARRAEAQPAPAFSYGEIRLTERVGDVARIPVVVAMVDYSDQRFAPQHTPAFFRQLMEGPGFPNSRDFFAENSGGKLLMPVDRVVGPLTFPDDPATTSADESRLACLDGQRCPGTRLLDPEYVRATVVREVARRVNLRGYDRDGDGVVTGRELMLLVVTAAPNVPGSVWGKWGGTRGVAGGCVPVGAKASATRVCLGGVPDIQEFASFQTLTHELTHALGLLYDYYGPWDRGGLNFGATVMGASVFPQADLRDSVDLDAFHRVRFGWARPRVVDVARGGACLRLDASHVGGASPSPERDPIVVFDSRRDPRDFFVIEHRVRSRDDAATGATPRSSYDVDVFGSGVVVWSVRTDPSTALALDNYSIRAGANAPLLSRPAAGSDDVLNAPFLDWGTDGLLQSTTVGTDTYDRTASAYALGIDAPDPARPGVFRTDAPGTADVIRREHRGVPLLWRGRVPSGVTLSVGPDDDRTRAVLLSVAGLQTTGDSSCVRAATPLPDREPRALVTASGGVGGVCFERPTVPAPSKSDASARAVAKPYVSIPLTIAFGGKLPNPTEVRVHATSLNTTVSRETFTAPTGTVSEAVEVRSTEPEPYAQIGLRIEISRTDLALKAPYVETHDVRFAITPDLPLGASDPGPTCRQVKSLQATLRELRHVRRDLTRPVPLPDPDPASRVTLADLAMASGPLATHRAWKLPFTKPFVPTDGFQAGGLVVPSTIPKVPGPTKAPPPVKP